MLVQKEVLNVDFIYLLLCSEPSSSFDNIENIVFAFSFF